MNPRRLSRAGHLVSNHEVSLIGRLMWRYVISRDAQKMTLDGLEVVADADSGRAVAVRARLALALELIGHYAPRIGARLRRDVVAIVLTQSGGTGYSPIMRVIKLDVRWAMVGTAESLALTLVHEATHARQQAMGVRMGYGGKGTGRRVEAQAVGQEIAFAERLPPGPWSRPTLEKLDMNWWSYEKRAERSAEALRDAGFPNWVSRVVAHTVRLLGMGR